MNKKRLVSLALSAVMMFASAGIIPIAANAEETPGVQANPYIWDFNDGDIADNAYNGIGISANGGSVSIAEPSADFAKAEGTTASPSGNALYINSLTTTGTANNAYVSLPSDGFFKSYKGTTVNLRAQGVLLGGGAAGHTDVKQIVLNGTGSDGAKEGYAAIPVSLSGTDFDAVRAYYACANDNLTFTFYAYDGELTELSADVINGLSNDAVIGTLTKNGGGTTVTEYTDIAKLKAITEETKYIIIKMIASGEHKFSGPWLNDIEFINTNESGDVVTNTLKEEFTLSFDMYDTRDAQTKGDLLYIGDGGTAAIYYSHVEGAFYDFGVSDIVASKTDINKGNHTRFQLKKNQWVHIDAVKTANHIIIYQDSIPIISLPLSDEANTRNGNSVRMGYTPWNNGGVGIYIDNLEIKDGIKDNKRIYPIGDKLAETTGSKQYALNIAMSEATVTYEEAQANEGQRFLIKPADIQNIYALTFKSAHKINYMKQTIDIYACVEKPENLGAADLTNTNTYTKIGTSTDIGPERWTATYATAGLKDIPENAKYIIIQQKVGDVTYVEYAEILYKTPTGERNYVAAAGGALYTTLDSAIEASNTVSVIGDAGLTANKSKGEYTFNGNGNKITNNGGWIGSLIINNAVIDSIKKTNLTDWGRFDNITINGTTAEFDCLILNDGYIKNSNIDGFKGVAVIANNKGNGTEISNTEITNSKVNEVLKASVRANANVTTITNSTITGTTDYDGNNADRNDVSITNGSVVLEGNTTIGKLSGATSENLTLKDFTGSVTLTGLSDLAAGTKLAKIEGEYRGTVTVDGLDSGLSVKVIDETTGEGETAVTTKYLVIKQTPQADKPENITVTDYTAEKLGGFESGVTYIITTGEGETTKTEEVTLGETENSIDITDYIGKTISIVRKGVSGETIDSDALQVTVPARPTAPVVTGEAAAVYQGNGKLKGTTTAMEYKSATDENAQWTDCTADMEIAPGSYIVRIKAVTTGTPAFASAPTEPIVVGDYTKTTEATPNIRIDYENEKLTDFTAGAVYSIKVGDAEAILITPETTEIAIVADYFDKTLTIVKKGTENMSNDSAGFGLSVPARPTAPMETQITVTQPQTYGEKGKIVGITTAMEYSTDNGATWTDGNGNAIENIEPGTTYKIRKKAVAGTSFKSAEYSVAIIAHGADPESTPNFAVNYADETLEQQGADGDYIITVDNTESTVAAVDGKIAVDSAWIGKAISIVKQGNGTSTTNSSPQSLTLGARADKPTGLEGVKPTSSAAQGKITGTTADMQYKSIADGSEWNNCTATETTVAAGIYVVRAKATPEKFASETVEVTVPEFEKSAWATPNISIDYANEKLTGFAENGSYTVKIGENGEAQSITLTDNKLDAAAYIGETIYIVKTGDSDHTDSPAQTLEVPARPQITDTNIKIDNDKEGVTVPAEYKYGNENDYANLTNEGTGALVTVAPETAIYIYKSAVTEGTKAFKSEIKALTAPARATISEPAISFRAETIGTTADMQYSTNEGTTWTPCTATMNVTAFGWNGTTAKKVKFRVPANENYYASTVSEITIPARQAAPVNGTDFTVNQPQGINAAGSISGLNTETMEYSTDGTNWRDVIAAEMNNLEVGSTHYFRFKATDNFFKSAATAKITINAFGARQETKPAFGVDFENETIKETDASGQYTVTVDGHTFEFNDVNDVIEINDEWFDKTIKIVKLGNGQTTTDSEEQEIEIKARPAAPQVTGGEEKIIDTTALMQYKKSDASSWAVCADNETATEPGEYNVRIAATATDFASAIVTVTVTQAIVDPPTPTPTPKPSITNARLIDENAEFMLNNAESYETATAYVAEYTENGALAIVKSQNIIINSAAQKVIVPFIKTNAENTVKLMVWQDMKPLSDAITLSNSAVPADYMAYYSFDGNYENRGSKSNVTSENVGVTKISNYSGNKVYGGSSPRSGVSSANTAAYSDDAHDGKSLSLDGTYGIALDSYIPAGKSFTVSYWTKYSENPIGNLNGNPVVLFDGSDYSETRGGYHDLKYIQAISGAYNKTACHVKGISPRTDKNLDVAQTGRYDMDSVEWVMNTITYDAKTSSLRVYQNGVVTDSDSFVVNEAIQSDMYITVGADQWGRGYKGLVDDLYIYDRILTADEIVSLYNPKIPEGFDEISQKQLVRRVEVPYKQLAETGEVYRCGVNYARAIQMQHEGEYKGRLYLTSEFYPDGRWDHHEFFPIWESVDYGESWQYVGKVEDTEHNKAQYVKDDNGKFTVKATEAQMADDNIEKDTYYGYEWRMRLQPTLYELPEDFGTLKAGTLLCTGMSTTTKTQATSDTDYDGDLQSSIDIFYSTDGGRNWEFYTHAMDGGLSYSGSGEPIWEPYLIIDNGYLYCLYSDEREMYVNKNQKGQRLVAVKINTDGSINEVFDVVNMTNVAAVGGIAARPGMPVVAPLKEGGFVMVYENMNYAGEAMGRTYMKFCDHIDDWKTDFETKGTFIGEAGGGSPYVCVLSDGKVVINSAGQSEVFVFADKAAAIKGEYTKVKTCIEASYTRSIMPMFDKNGEEKLLIARGGSYWTTVDLPTGPSKLVTGVLDINELYERIK